MSSMLVRIAFHVEIDESAQLSRAAQKRPQLRREMGDCIRRIFRTDLRIKRRNFDRNIYNRKKLGVFAQRIGPVSCFTRETLQQIEVTRRILVGLRFANHSFSQKVDREANFLSAALSQYLQDIVRISSGDELTRHFGDVPPQDGPAKPWNDARQTNAGAQKL